MVKAKKNSRAVYSTDRGRLCPQCLRNAAECVCRKDRPSSSGDGIVRITRETKGRGGKAVTVISGLPVTPEELKVIAKKLKQRCGVGGSTKEAKIAFLEVANDELEQALLSQHKRLEQVEVTLNELRNRLKEQAALIEHLGDSDEEPAPPHY